jgi:hypothetical protein
MHVQRHARCGAAYICKHATTLTCFSIWVQEEAFVMASDAVSAPQLEPPQPDFIESQQFVGAKSGFVFKHDIYGCGYYKDEAAQRTIEVTLESILAEKAERLEREARMSARNALPKFDSITA